MASLVSQHERSIIALDPAPTCATLDSMGHAHPPHRIEDGFYCIDIRVRGLGQLFDGRDPMPFHDGALDADAMDTILAIAEDLPTRVPLKIVFHLHTSPDTPADPREAHLPSALAAHFGIAAGRAQRRLKRHRRSARTRLLMGLVAFLLTLTAAELLTGLRDSTFARLLPEGLMILGWVVMWRPLDALLFDGWPIVAERRLCQRVAAAPVEIRRTPTSHHPRTPDVHTLPTQSEP